MGIDIHRIAQNLETLPQEHFCPVCQLLINPNEALQSVCGHLYCTPCLTYVASTTRMCPSDGYMVTEIYAKPLMECNKVLADTIGKTLVYCSYQNIGCTWVGSLADSSFHCYTCAFGLPLVMSSWCGINIPHSQGQEHVQVCLGAYTQASVAAATTQATVAMATSQPSARGHAVASSMMTQEQWYQQPYQPFYQNYIGDYMQRQPIQRQRFSPHNQVIYVQVRPSVHHVAQTDSQMQQPQPQVQSQSLAMHQPHDAFPSPHANTVHDSLAHNTMGQCQSNQPHAFWTVQNPQPNQINQEHHIHEGQSYHPHISVQEHQPMNPILGVQPNINHFSATAPQVSMTVVEEDDMQKIPKQVHWVTCGQNKVLHIYGNKDDEAVMEAPDTTNTVFGVNLAAEVTTVKSDHKLKGRLTDDAPSLQRIPKQVHWPPLGQDKVLHIYGNKNDEAVMEAPDSTNTVFGVNLAAEVTTVKSDHKLKGKLTDAAPSLQRIPKQVHWSPLGQDKLLHIYGNKDDEAVMEAPDSTNTVFGVNLAAEVTTVKSGHKLKGKLTDAAPSLQRIPKQVHWPPLGQDKVLHIYGNKDDEAVMEVLKSDLTSDSTNVAYNVNRAAEVTTVKFDHKLKGKLTEASSESLHGSSIVVEGNELKSGPLGKQVVKENVENGWVDLGKSLLVEKKNINDDSSLDGTPLMDPILLDQDGLQQLRDLVQHNLMIAEKSTASAGSLDGGFDQRSSVRTHKKHEPGFELRPALRSSQPSMDLGEGRFRSGPRSPISKHLGMPSHGYGPSGGRSDLHRSEFTDLGNLQMGEKVIAGDMIGPVDSNGPKLEDVGSQSRYPGDGGSFPGTE